MKTGSRPTCFFVGAARPTTCSWRSPPTTCSTVPEANGNHSLSLDDRPGPWLDLSGGPGAFARALAAAAPGALVVGLDISRAMLDVAAQRTSGYTNAVLIRADAHALPFVDGAFGGVNNAGALHTYDDPELVFREIRRVLRPGGIYVGSTFAEAESLLGRIAARAAGIRRFETGELRAWLQGIRPGEKLHEQMISPEDSFHTYEYPKYYKILPALHHWSIDANRIKDGRKVPEGFVYASDTNSEWMDTETLRQWIETNRGKIGSI